MSRRHLALAAFLLITGLACQALYPTTAGNRLFGKPKDGQPRGAELTLGAKPTSPAPLTVATTTTPALDDVQRHQRIFRYVWETVARNYIYPDFNGVDWDAVRETFRPRIEMAPDDEAFWRLMQEMVGQLGDEHSDFLEPDEVDQEDATASGALDYVGIGIYVAVADSRDYAVVLFPLPNSPAAEAGIRAHERILTIDGVAACCTADGADNLDLMLGQPDTEVTLTVQYPGEEPREVTLVRERIQTELPIISRRVSQGSNVVAYLMVPTFWDETISERTREVLAVLLSEGAVSGVVLDMRINGGGAYTELYDLLSLFVSGEVGSFRRRGSAQESLVIDASPVGGSQTLPLVVLIGSATESYAEVFSGVVQGLDRGKLVGQPTAGNVETVYPYDLEDGSRLWLAEETFEPLSGERWEGVGVQPDVPVLGNWEDFTEDDDPQLRAALDLLSEMMRVE